MTRAHWGRKSRGTVQRNCASRQSAEHRQKRPRRRRSQAHRIVIDQVKRSLGFQIELAAPVLREEIADHKPRGSLAEIWVRGLISFDLPAFHRSPDLLCPSHRLRANLQAYGIPPSCSQQVHVISTPTSGHQCSPPLIPLAHGLTNYVSSICEGIGEGRVRRALIPRSKVFLPEAVPSRAVGGDGSGELAFETSAGFFDGDIRPLRNAGGHGCMHAEEGCAACVRDLESQICEFLYAQGRARLRL